MTTGVIVAISVLVIIAYLFDISSSKTKIPSVILLLALGWLVARVAEFLDLAFANLTNFLPILGTVGLILIVLEGSLDLEYNRSKLGTISKTFLLALIPLIVFSAIFAGVLVYVGQVSWHSALVNAIPLAVISSAIAIPSVANLSSYFKEFVIYESSFSDILGVVFFNFFALHTVIDGHSIGNFFLQLLAIIIISFIATGILSFLLSKIHGHVKFVPITMLVLLIYGISKIYHLPALVFILVFGLFLGNLDQFKRFKWIKALRPSEMDIEVKKFKELIMEATFLVRTLFFLLFGFLIKTEELIDLEALIWTAFIIAIIYILRAICLLFANLPIKPLLFVAPRGLITILLFLSIPVAHQLEFINNSVVIQVIVLSGLILMGGLMSYRQDHTPIESNAEDEGPAPIII